MTQPGLAACQGQGAVADAPVTCVAVGMVAILCVQFGVFLSLINPSRAGGNTVFFRVRTILTEPSKVHVLHPPCEGDKPKPLVHNPYTLHPFSHWEEPPAHHPWVLLPGWPRWHQQEEHGCSMKEKLSDWFQGEQDPSLHLQIQIVSWLMPWLGDTLRSFKWLFCKNK